MNIKLNIEQQKMVDSEGNLLVTACPGSGKTRALTSKISYELERIKNKQYIVAITFTNRAAEEIQRRLDKMNVDSSSLWTGTIHAFCMEWILKPYANYIDRLKNGFILIDEYKQKKLKEELREKFKAQNLIEIKWSRKGCLSGSSEQEQIIFDEYNRILIENKWIDFESLLYLSYKLLSDKLQIAETLSRVFKLICVDEYQDTSDLQYAILGLIIKAGKGKTNIIMVGDPNQAIYDSLGGIAKTVEEIQEEIGGFPVTQMEFSGNYRSTQKVINFYKNFQINSNDIRAKLNDKNSKITLNQKVTSGSLSNQIANIITDELNKGIKQNQICIIAPRWWLLISMARELQSILPHINFDAPGLSPLPKAYDNFWFKLSKLLLTTSSSELFLSRKKWANEIIAELKYISGRQDLYIKEKELTSKVLLKFSNFMINYFDENEIEGIKYLEKSFDQFIKNINIDINSYQLLVNQYNFFFNGIHSRLNQNGFNGENQKLYVYKNVFKELKGVVVNSCQGIKGEEFETVIAFGLLNGFIPHSSVESKEKSISSKKLMYVIGSRAKTNLYLIAEEGRNKKINDELEKIIFEYDDL